MWIAEDGKYVSNLLLCPTADPKAWESSCWSPLLHAGSFLSALSCSGACSPSHSLLEAVLLSSPVCPSVFPTLHPRQTHRLTTLAGYEAATVLGEGGDSRQQSRMPRALSMTHIVQATKEA